MKAMLPDDIKSKPSQPPCKKVEFKFKEEILFRKRNKNGKWCYGIFSHYDNDTIYLAGGNLYALSIYEFIPLKGNEKLIGKNGEEKVHIAPNTPCLFFNCKGSFYSLDTSLCRMKKAGEELFIDTMERGWVFCIPILEFNPDDMDASWERVCCVKDNKMYRLKSIPEGNEYF